MIKISQIVLVKIAHRVIERFCSDLRVLNFLELQLILFQKLRVLLINHFADTQLLILYTEERVAVALEGTLQATHDFLLGVHSVLIELSAIIILSLLLQSPEVIHLFQAPLFFCIHFCNKFLPPL